MEYLLGSFVNRPPEIVFEWNDRETTARGWVVINSLRNGAAGGGTRMRKGLTRDEVEALAKVMEIKFTVSGPPIGGAKSGIDFDPEDPRRDEVLERWFRAIKPLLMEYHGTGGDLNVDELKDVIPITESLGIWHPQEGIVTGHLGPRNGDHINAIGQLRYGCTKIIEDGKYSPDVTRQYAVADMITGWGVAESVRHWFNIFKGQGLMDKRVIVQGWGNVASAAAYYLSKSGAKIAGIIDRTHGLISREGLDVNLVRELFANKNGNRLNAEAMRSSEEIDARIWDLEADIFIPGAASRLITRDQVDRMIQSGLQVISCGANVPFTDDKFLFGPSAEYTDNKIGLIPDFVANCGMARVFAYLMGQNVEITDEDIFFDVSNVVFNTLKEVHSLNPSGTHCSKTALKIALQKITAKH